MQMLYNSDSFAVLQINFDVVGGDPSVASRGGFEIVDKFARKGIFIEGAVAQGFKDGVQALMDTTPRWPSNPCICTESLRVFRPGPLVTPKDARSSLQMLAIARAMTALCV
jgi:Protein of unknown function (DUF3567)